MSRAEKIIMGLEHGKIGDRIAVVLDGKQIYKKLYKPTNPRTPKQQMHRAKLAFVNRLSKELAEAVNLGFEMVPEKGSGQTARNAFVKMNWDNGSVAWEEEKGEWGIVPQRLVLAFGPRYICRDIAAEVRDRRLHVSCPDSGLDDPHAVGDDRLMVTVYRPAVPTMHLYPGPLRKACKECCFDLPADAGGEEDVMHVYAWFQATTYHRSGGGKITVRPGQASPSVYLGSFQA